MTHANVLFYCVRLRSFFGIQDILLYCILTSHMTNAHDTVIKAR